MTETSNVPVVFVPVVFVPAAPMLLPTLNPTPTAEQSQVLDACLQAVAALSDCTRVIVVGSPGVGLRPDSDRPGGERPGGTGPGYGLQPLPAPTPGTAPDDDPLTPVSILVAAELLTSAGFTGDLDWYVAGGAATATQSLGLEPGDGVLVVGDGTATGHEKAPGHVVPGATDLDDAIADQLARADLAALLDLDPDADEHYLLDGRPAWQAATQLVQRCGHVTTSDLVGRFAPHQVTYFVAQWQVTLDG